MQFVIRSLTTQQKKMGFFIDFLIKNGVGRWMRRFKKKRWKYRRQSLVLLKKVVKTMAIQSLSLAGTQTVGPDCSRITSLTLA